jgi:hypothetical protein
MEQAIFAAGFNRLSNSKLVRLARGAIQGLHRLVALEAEARIIPSEFQVILKTGPLREAALSACFFS